VAYLVLHNMLINFLDKTEFEDDDDADSTNIVETSIQDRNETSKLGSRSEMILPA
jgi:hypothetical protein